MHESVNGHSGRDMLTNSKRALAGFLAPSFLPSSSPCEPALSFSSPTCVCVYVCVYVCACVIVCLSACVCTDHARKN